MRNGFLVYLSIYNTNIDRFSEASGGALYVLSLGPLGRRSVTTRDIKLSLPLIPVVHSYKQPTPMQR